MTDLELNWDYLRIFLAVMRSSSLRQAAERLGVSHPTIRRKLESLEEQLGLRLFDRRPDGLHATPEASVLLEKAEQVEASVHALGRCASNAAPALQGWIHVTAPDLLMSDLLAPALAAFVARWPQIELRVETTYKLADLGSREADVALRLLPLGQLPDGELVGKKAATAYTAVYGHAHQWIGWADTASQLERIRETPFADLPIRGVMNNIYLQRAACLAGMGLSILPCFMADPRLVQRTEPKPAGAIWVLVHPDLRRNPRLRLFRDEMVAALKQLRPQLEGRAEANRCS